MSKFLFWNWGGGQECWQSVKSWFLVGYRDINNWLLCSRKGEQIQLDMSIEIKPDFFSFKEMQLSILTPEERRLTMEDVGKVTRKLLSSMPGSVDVTGEFL